MTREEYLDILQNNLHGIPPQEAENIMEYYREYFDDAGVENAEKVMQELGAPEQLAKRAAADAAAENGFAGAAGSGQNPGFGSDNGQTAAKKKHTAAGITLAVITSPIWASLLLAAVCVLFAVVITVAAVGLSLGFAAAVMVAAGLFTVGTALVTVFLHIPTAVMLIGAGLVSVGLGLLAALLTYGCVIGIKKFVMWISNKEWRNAKIHKPKIFA